MVALRVRGVNFNYELDGPEDGTPLVLSNSLASNLHMWDAQMAALVADGWRVLRYDNRGHGRTEAVAGPYSIDMLSDDMVALLDAVGLDTVHFCGLSLGGMVGQMTAVRHAGRLRSLTLCDTAAYMGPFSLWAERIAAVESGGMATVVEGTVQRWFTAAGRERLPGEVDTIRAGIAATSAAGYCGCCAAIRDMDQRESIRGITVPTHVIVGADDPSTPVTSAQLIHEHIAGSRLTVIPAAAHLANIEQAALFNVTLLDFLRSQR